jgi:hypothetical protein
MVKIKFCVFGNDGATYNILPAILVTPLREVVATWRLVPLNEFKNSTPCAVKLLYPVRGVRIALKFWTFHVGVQFG